MWIPDSLPYLSKGNHKPGSGKACALDAVSYIMGDPGQMDTPECVHPMLRSAIMELNDRADDVERQKLWPVLMRVIGTWEVGAELDKAQGRLVMALNVWSGRRLLAGHPELATPLAKALLRQAEALVVMPSRQNRIALTTARRRYEKQRGGFNMLVCRAFAPSGGADSADAALASVRVFAQHSFATEGMDAALRYLDDLLDERERLIHSQPVDVAVAWDELTAMLGGVPVSV